MYEHRGESIRKFPEKPIGKSPGKGVQEILRKAIKIRGYIIRGQWLKHAEAGDSKIITA